MRQSREQIEKERIDFINRCTEHDRDRLLTEPFPDSALVKEDGASYAGDDLAEHRYDLYIPAEGPRLCDEAFILIHGGAFVYGTSLLDKRYGMYLAARSGLMVFNLNYRLLPDTGICGSIEDICRGVSFISEKYNIRKIHVTGDSAGGYLALATVLCHRPGRFAEELKIAVNKDVTAVSAGLICGVYLLDKESFPGALFEKEEELPDHMYDLCAAAARSDMPPMVLITGEGDYLREDSLRLKKICDEAGIRAELLDYKAVPGRDMHHVFPVSDPTWPESCDAIEAISACALSESAGA